jgi:hypothetical protein
MACLTDRFNVISNITESTEITIDDYIRNYMDDNIICHQCLIKSQFNEKSLNMFFKNYIRQLRSNYIRMNKSYNKTSIRIIYYNIIDFKNKIEKLLNKFNSKNEEIIKNTMNLYFDIIISSPFMKSIYNHAFMNNIDIKPFFSFLLQNFDEEKYDNCLKMFGNTIEENIQDIKILNYKYENIMFVKKLFDYTFNIIKRYSKIVNIEIIFEKFYVKIYETIENIISKNTNDFIINFLKVFSNEFIQICSKYSKLSNVIYAIKINNIQSLISMIKIIKDIKSENNLIKEYVSHNQNLCNDENIKNLAFMSIENIKNKIDNKYIYLIVSSFEKNTDLFFSILEMFLKKRIIYCGSTYDNEIKEFNVISKYFKPSLYYKYHKIINDLKNNKNIGIQNTNIFYISDNIWGMNTQKGYDIYDNTKFYLHLGNANITLKNAVTSYKINCLPIHVEIIKLIIKNKHKMTGNFKNYSEYFICMIEEQLVNKNVIKLTSDGYIMNDYYDEGDVDLVEEYFNQNTDKIIQNVIEELAHDRKHIIMTNIMSIHKKHNDIHLDEIYHMIKETIKFFDFDKEYFNTVINEMQEKEYI